MSRKNTCRTFHFQEPLPTELEVAERGFLHKARQMLKPPLSFFGIPAMRKLEKEIHSWTDNDSYSHMVAYAGLTPPLVTPDLSQNDGLRFEQARVLKELGQKYRREKWSQAATLFLYSGEMIVKLCEQAINYDGNACAALLEKIADTEEAAYLFLAETKD
ncbi:DUF4872 domain-containing protein [Chloroflexota bacterium]